MSKKLTVRWNLLKLICGECGEELVIREGPWGSFYACSAYPKCYNRMNLDIYEKILDEIEEKMRMNPRTILTNHVWRYKTGYQFYEFKVVKQLPGQYLISVLNIKKRNAAY
ncbi:MAG: Topoisomerase binding zinc finger [Caldanaerobacter sp.]|nr:Topoisomerase binding zinc finger [Caldanaerobacter sp.]